MTSKITKTVVLGDLRRVAKQTGTNRPTRSQYRARGVFSSWLVEARFGTWSKALRKI